MWSHSVLRALCNTLVHIEHNWPLSPNGHQHIRHKWMSIHSWMAHLCANKCDCISKIHCTNHIPVRFHSGAVSNTSNCTNFYSTNANCKRSLCRFDGTGHSSWVWFVDKPFWNLHDFWLFNFHEKVLFCRFQILIHTNFTRNLLFFLRNETDSENVSAKNAASLCHWWKSNKNRHKTDLRSKWRDSKCKYLHEIRLLFLWRVNECVRNDT